MSSRYSLRFESGERSGESIPVEGPTFTVGRRPGSSLQILDASVSGKHAELRFDGSDVTLCDLGSTNGTRVNGERVLELSIQPGSQITFGNVTLMFESPDSASSAQTAGIGSVASVAALPGESASDSAGRAARIERATGSRRVGGLVLVALALAAGAAWWFFRGGEEAKTRRGGAGQPVAEVAGNLVLDGSFEDGGTGWDADTTGTATFRIASGSGRSGRMGLIAEPAGGERAVHRSNFVDVPAKRTVQVAASLRSERATARLGLEWLSSDDATGEGAPPFVIWSDPSQGDWAEVQIEAIAPPGYARARVLVEAKAGPSAQETSAEIDDVSLVMGGNGSATAEAASHGIWGNGPAPTSGVLTRVETPLLVGIRFETKSSTLPFQVTASETSLVVTPETQVASTLIFRVTRAAQPTVLRTLGSGGTRAHREAFARDGVTDLLLGDANGRLFVRFQSPVALAAELVAGTWRFRAELAAGQGMRCQVRFPDEQAAALGIARQARDAMQAGRPATSLAQWTRLLETAPWDGTLVAEAEASVAMLEREGLVEANRLREELEHARFFRLADIFRTVRDASAELAERYVGTSVEDEARLIEHQAGLELAGLVKDRDRREVQRLRAVHAALVAQGAESLASEVQNYLDDMQKER